MVLAKAATAETSDNQSDCAGCPPQLPRTRRRVQAACSRDHLPSASPNTSLTSICPSLAYRPPSRQAHCSSASRRTSRTVASHDQEAQISTSASHYGHLRSECIYHPSSQSIAPSTAFPALLVPRACHSNEGVDHLVESLRFLRHESEHSYAPESRRLVVWRTPFQTDHGFDSQVTFHLLCAPSRFCFNMETLPRLHRTFFGRVSVRRVAALRSSQHVNLS